MVKIINQKTWVIIILLSILGGILRFGNLAINPPGLTVDEVSSGFNSYSILKTGKDEYGTFLPVSFRSLNDYKPPLYIYLSTIPIWVFGLNEFSVRFLSALIGVLSIPVSFLLFWKISKKKGIALLGTALFAISPWHIFYSHLGFESPVAMSLVMLGIWSFLKMLEGSLKWGVFSAVALALSCYTYHSERIFVPLFIFYLFWIYREKIQEFRKTIFYFSIPLVIFALPVIISVFFNSGGSRIAMTLITNDPDFIRNIYSATTAHQNFWIQIFGGKYLLLFFFILNKIISYLQPSYLFFQGLNMTQIGSFGLGLMYLFETPFFIVGLFYYLREKNIQRQIIFGWLVLGILPAAITQDTFNPIRLLLVTPMVVLLSATGGIICYNWLIRLTSRWKYPVVFIFGGFVIWNLIYAFLIFTVHFPVEKSEDYLYGSKQSALFAILQKDNYQEIVMDPVRGTLAPDIRNVPHLYLLFYSKYDPLTYQTMPKRISDGVYGFDKFTIREIDWRVDQKKKGTLFIGSPWRFTDSNIKPEQIKQKFYLLSGQLALMAVSP